MRYKLYKSVAILIIAIFSNGCADGRLFGGAVKISGIGIGTTDRGRGPDEDPLQKSTFKTPVETQKLAHLNIERKGDGFISNGKRYIDPFGKTVHVSKLSDTGYVSYTVKNPKNIDKKGSYIVKVKNAISESKPVYFGHLYQQKIANVYFTQNEGETYNGDQFILYSKGIILTRDRTVVMYFSLETEPKIHILPDGYVFSAYQQGDVSFSKHITIQRRIGQATGLLGTTLLNVDEFDVSLFNIETGKITTTLNMQLRGADESEQTEHFKNVFYLFNSRTGPITISLEDGYKKVVARNLVTGKKQVVFRRESGVSFLKAGLTNGKIWTEASLGFSDKKVNDVENLLLEEAS